MTDNLQIRKSQITLMKADITDIEIDAFVFYARSDLQLGSGFGTAISVRGGPSVQQELKKLGSRNITDVVTTSAGDMKANYIIHAVGPKFQEANLENKLKLTIQNALKEADAKGITRLAFPAMGAGFYGIPLPESARITIDTIYDYLAGETSIKEVVISLLDTREYKPYESHLSLRAQNLPKETTV